MRILSTCLALAVFGCTLSLAAADDPKAAPSAVVSIEVLIADFAQAEQGDEDEKPIVARIRELEKQGKLSRVTRLQMTTLSDQIAMAQFGERTALATGRAMFAGGGGRGAGGPGAGGEGSTSFAYQNVGTMARFTPRVEGNKVTMECTVEQSRLVPRKPAAATPERPDVGFQPDSVENITAQSVVQVKSGETVLLTSRQQTSGDVTLRTYILVTATIMGEAKKEAERKDAAVLKIFSLAHAKAEVAGKLLVELTKDNPVQITADARTNSLLLQGSAEDLAVCEALLLKLDEK